MLFLIQHLLSQLERLELVRVVVEVDGGGGLLEEVSALHLDLGIILYVRVDTAGLRATSLQSVDAISLLRLVLLSQNDLVKVHWSGLRLIKKRLEVVCHILLRDLDWAEAVAMQYLVLGQTSAVRITYVLDALIVISRLSKEPLK